MADSGEVATLSDIDGCWASLASGDIATIVDAREFRFWAATAGLDLRARDADTELVVVGDIADRLALIAAWMPSARATLHDGPSQRQ